MRIAYIAHIRFPSERAHAVQIVHMANAFAAEGHTVDLFVSSRATAVTETPEEYYGVRFLFAVQRVPIVDIVARIHSFPKAFHPVLYNLERFLFLVSFMWRMRTHAADVFYCRDEIILGCLSYFFPGQRLVWESHEGKANFFARRLLRKAQVVVISEGIKSQYLSMGFAGERIVVAHDAIDDTFFETPITHAEARSRLGLSNEKPIAMYIGGFDAWKGVYTFFEAAAYMPQVHVVAIGGTHDLLQKLRTQYPAVHFLGARPYKDLRDNQQAADVLVIPNTAKNALSAKFTSPLKLFSHLTSRVPLVLSDIPSLRAVVDDEAAYFFTPDDPESLARTVEYVLAHTEEARRKAGVAHERSRHYTWKKRAAAIMAALMHESQSLDREK